MTTPAVVGTNRLLGSGNATSMSKIVSYNYISTIATQKIFVAPIKLRLTAIFGVPTTAGSGGACTLSFYKAADGIAIASGTILHSGSYNVAGTADVNQYLTLVAPGGGAPGGQGTIGFEPGDCFGFVLTGTATSAVGTITAVFEPIA